MLRRLLNKYKNFAITTLPRFYRKIPKLILYSAAAFGFFCLGIIFVFIVDPYKDYVTVGFHQDQADKYFNLIEGYEELSNLYYYQGQNMNVITDLNMIENNPSEVADAFRSADSYRDKILVQQGRIIELRKSAGIYEPEESPETQ